MTEEQLLKGFSAVYRIAFDANNYYELLMQYDKCLKENQEIVKFSPAFWGVTKAALSYACLMDVAKLYDNTKNVISIEVFFSKESFLFLSNLESEHTITKYNLYKMLGLPLDENDYSRYNDLSVQEILGVLSRIKKDLHDKIELLRTYRNKAYAHNDKDRVVSPDDFKDIPALERESMKSLVDFAMNTCRVIRFLITGSYGTTQYANIDDIHGVFQLLQFGMYEQKKMEDCWKKGINYHPPTVYESGD